MKNVKYLDVDFHYYFRDKLKLQDMNDLRLIVVMETLQIKI